MANGQRVKKKQKHKQVSRLEKEREKKGEISSQRGRKSSKARIVKVRKKVKRKRISKARVSLRRRIYYCQ